MVLTPGGELSATGVSLTALKERVHCDRAIPPGRTCFVLMEDFASGSAVFSKLREGLDMVLSDFDAENATLKGDYLRQVVEILIGGVPTVLEICFM